MEAALKNRHRQFVIDGEAIVVPGVGGIADFNAESGWCQQPDPTGESSMTTAKPSARCGAICERACERLCLPSYTITGDMTFVYTACGKRGADVRPDFNWNKHPVEMMGYR